MEKVTVLLEYEDENFQNAIKQKLGYLIDNNHVMYVDSGWLEFAKVEPVENGYVKTSGTLFFGKGVPEDEAEETIKKMVDFMKNLDFFTFLTKYHDTFESVEFDYFVKLIKNK
ncbi:hypothetical protein V7138_10295 [Bacillus sp. JJ1533]|uniref:hypothetical protein n=1 Tax=Bacillus sp. JJ1533 TaxID=3122959 RepID=UPI002FFE49E2